MEKYFIKLKEMTDEQAQKIGESLIEILNLRVTKKGWVNTLWGDKSPSGLARVVDRILNHNESHKEHILS